MEKATTLIASEQQEGSAASRKIGPTRVDEVSQQLRDLIADGEMKVGDKLPSQAGLTELYGVSRTVIREALALLSAEGLVEVQHGVGAFVCEPNVRPQAFKPVDRARISSMIDLLELRAAIEIEAAGLAAKRRSPAQEEELFRRYEALSRLGTQGDAAIEADFHLHLAVANAANNPRFREFLMLIGESLIPRSALPKKPVVPASPEYFEKIQAEHWAIIQAISARDSEAASSAMRAHLKGSESRYRRLIRRNQV